MRWCVIRPLLIKGVSIGYHDADDKGASSIMQYKIRLSKCRQLSQKERNRHDNAWERLLRGGWSECDPSRSVLYILRLRRKMRRAIPAKHKVLVEPNRKKRTRNCRVTVVIKSRQRGGQEQTKPSLCCSSPDGFPQAQEVPRQSRLCTGGPRE